MTFPPFGSVAVTLSVGEVPTFVAQFAGEFKLGGISGVDDEAGGGDAGRAAASATLLDAPREARAAYFAAETSRLLADRFLAHDVPRPDFRPDPATAATIKKPARRRARSCALGFGNFIGPSYL